MQLAALLLLLLSLATCAQTDEAPPMSLTPESPRPNRRYWRWEEFPPASLGEGCQPRETWKRTIKDEEVRRVAAEQAAVAQLEMKAGLAQCSEDIESMRASNAGQQCEDGDATPAAVGCAGSDQGSADGAGTTWNCGTLFQAAAGASSFLPDAADRDTSAACLVPEGLPKLEYEPIEPLTCIQLVPASEELAGVWECAETCVFRQCGYVCEYNEFTEEMKCAWDLEPCAVSMECDTADLSAEESDPSRASCEAVPQGKGTECVYTSKGAGVAHIICVVLFLGFLALMIVSVVPVIGKPWWAGFQERGAALLTLNGVSAIIFAWATLVTDNHAPGWLLGGQTNSRLWLGWLRLGFGFGLWHCTIATRLQAMGQLYLHDAEPLFWALKLLQYMSPWLTVVILTTYSDDPPVTLSAGVIFLSFFSFFHSVYLAAPLLKLKKTLPEVPAHAFGAAAGLVNICWIYIAIEQEADDGCSEAVPLPCTPSNGAADASHRKFLGTVLSIMILTVYHLWANGRLLKAYVQGDPAYLEQFEAPPSKRQPDYQTAVEPEPPPEYEDEDEREARRLKERGESDEEGAEVAEGESERPASRGIGATFTDLFASATKGKGIGRVRKGVVDPETGELYDKKRGGGRNPIINRKMTINADGHMSPARSKSGGQRAGGKLGV